MLEYTKGNLLDANTEALVNTVNEVGIMGKGIALMFKDLFPAASSAYMAACKEGRIRVGHVFATPSEQLFPKWIIHFPTKRHWRHPSKIEWIRAGLNDLARTVLDLDIKSIAIPPLGCGNGGLDWEEVRPLIEEAFARLPRVDVLLYEPTTKYYHSSPKQKRVTDLTPARALIVELVRRYSMMGLDCTFLEVQKLAYFLHASIIQLGLKDPLSLVFTANQYGPYADRLRHLLNALDGSYFHSAKRINDATPYDHLWFKRDTKTAVEEYLTSSAKEYLDALTMTEATIEGFESPLGLELLSTVHWLLTHAKADPSLAAIKHGLRKWPGGKSAAARKSKLFDDRLLTLALSRLTSDKATDDLPASSEKNS